MGSKSDVKCQSIYRNLLLAQGAAQNHNAIVYLRELQHTARCNTFYDFTRMRASFAEVLGPAGMERISSFDETEKDERMAKQAVTHYHDWVDFNLQSALSLPSWLWYQTVHKVERTVSMLSIPSGVFGGWRFVRSSHHKW